MTTIKLNRRPLQKSFGSILDELFTDAPFNWANDWRNQTVPPVNIHETEDALHLEVNAPGLNKENFNISVEDNTLTIGFEKKQETDASAHKTIRREFSFESFKRSFNLGEEINADTIQAKYENGILKLYLPKKEVVKEATKQINIQ
jgi:HSP20 family protein